MSSLKHLLDRNRRWAARRQVAPAGFLRGARAGTGAALLLDRLLGQPRPRERDHRPAPGELFVHRNVANVVVHTDLNCLSALQFAVDSLRSRACDGRRPSRLRRRPRRIPGRARSASSTTGCGTCRTSPAKHTALLERLPDDGSREDRLCELNVIEQVVHVARTTIVQDAWQRGQPLDRAWLDLRPR